MNKPKEIFKVETRGNSFVIFNTCTRKTIQWFHSNCRDAKARQAANKQCEQLNAEIDEGDCFSNSDCE